MSETTKIQSIHIDRAKGILTVETDKDVWDLEIGDPKMLDGLIDRMEQSIGKIFDEFGYGEEHRGRKYNRSLTP